MKKLRHATGLRSLALLAALLIVTTAAQAAERAIEKTIDVNASVDDVWDAWTSRAGIVSFFAPDAKIEPRVGGAFEVYIDPEAAPGMKGADDMRFMALQPKQMLSFTWNAPPHLPEARAQRTLVILRFQPVGDKQTRVTLHHVGWGDGGDWDKAYAYFDKAWGGVLANLKKRFDQGPQDWTEWLAQLRKYHEDAAAKAAKGAK